METLEGLHNAGGNVKWHRHKRTDTVGHDLHEVLGAVKFRETESR